MRVTTMIQAVGPDGYYGLVSPDCGLVMGWFASEREAVEYAVTQGWEVF